VLSRLSITNLRNIVSTDVEFSSRLNLIVGDNGSGKTSLLEAVYYLATTRSFRNAQISPLITYNEKEAIVFGIMSDVGGAQTRIGVSRSLDGKREIRVNGETVPRASDLARLLPVLVLGPQTVDLLLGSPQVRRSFLNWGVFHVKPEFSVDWDVANRCLKHRNKLLKGRYQEEELTVWTDRLVESAEKIDRNRSEYFTVFRELYLQEISELAEFGNRVDVEYVRGWDTKCGLETVYLDSIQVDKKRGFTQHGFQKADIKLSINGRSAAEVCSRGELKMLAWAMVLTQGKLKSKVNDHRVLYLVDDLVSELDFEHRKILCKNLFEMNGQVMATGIDKKELEASWNGQLAKVFHVKQGVLSTLSGTLEYQNEQ
jgi:DNA replication and repair protein RecF